MAATRPTVLFISVVLLSSACATKDSAYERAMDEWADKSCDCLMLPPGDATECMKTVKEPEFPSHWADAMMDNPNYAVGEPFRKQVADCQKAYAERAQNPGL